MSDTVLRRYESCVSIVKKLLLFAPIWFDNRFQYCVKCLLIPFLACFGLIIGYRAFDKAIQSSDMSVLTECMVPAIELFAVPFKMMPAVIFKETIRELYEKLDTDIRFYYTNQSTAMMEKGSFRMFSLFISFLHLLYRMLVLNYVVVPILFMFYQIAARKSPVILILPYPGDHADYIMNNSMLYAILFSLEALNAWVSASTGIACHCLFGLTIFQMAAVLNAVSNNLAKANTEQELFHALRVCVDKQSLFRNYSHKMETTYGAMIFSQRLVDAIVLCGVIFQLHQIAGLDLGRVIMYASWIFIKFLQQLTYGWFGSQLIVESENFRNAVYSCKWPEFTDDKLMKRIVYILQQPPLEINACGFFVISIPMASSVITTSFSYFFLLQSVDAES